MHYKEYKDIVYKIIGAAMEVHRNLGAGLLEALYGEALIMELADEEIECETEKLVHCYYKGHQMSKFYKMDLVIGGVVVEIKSADALSTSCRKQLFNYLRLTKSPMGLLINFGPDKLEGERYGYDDLTNTYQRLDKNMNMVFEH